MSNREPKPDPGPILPSSDRAAGKAASIANALALRGFNLHVAQALGDSVTRDVKVVKGRRLGKAPRREKQKPEPEQES